MYPDSVSRVHFLFVLIYGKSGFFIKFVKTYSISCLLYTSDAADEL